MENAQVRGYLGDGVSANGECLLSLRQLLRRVKIVCTGLSLGGVSDWVSRGKDLVRGAYRASLYRGLYHAAAPENPWIGGVQSLDSP